MVGAEAVLAGILSDLKSHLGQNLYSVIAYGSIVRGDWVASASDVNLFIVLEKSTPPAHEAIASIHARHAALSPMVAEREGLLRTFRCFAAKFLSIRRNYRVLHGVDCLKELVVDPALERFLVEQALRNLQMRCTNAFVTQSRDARRYTQLALRFRSATTTHVSTMLRLEGVEVPKPHIERLPIIERELGAQTAVLRDLASVKAANRRLRADEIPGVHTRLYALLDAALGWIEARWTLP